MGAPRVVARPHLCERLRGALAVPLSMRSLGPFLLPALVATTATTTASLEVILWVMTMEELIP